MLERQISSDSRMETEGYRNMPTCVLRAQECSEFDRSDWPRNIFINNSRKSFADTANQRNTDKSGDDEVGTSKNVVDEVKTQNSTLADFDAEEKGVAAILASLVQQGSLTPLIKDELKTKIQLKRLKEGREELKVEFNKPQPKQMSEGETERALIRREQNRKAAQRFRMRQKETATRLLKKTEKLESSNTSLRATMRKLKQEKAELETLLQNHLRVCNYLQSGNG